MRSIQAASLNRTPRQLTIDDDPEVFVNSGWGRITNLAWSTLTANSEAAKGIPSFVRQNGADRIAVFVGRPGEADKVIHLPEMREPQS